jgi:hypothetical protein
MVYTITGQPVIDSITDEFFTVIENQTVLPGGDPNISLVILKKVAHIISGQAISLGDIDKFFAIIAA